MSTIPSRDMLGSVSSSPPRYTSIVDSLPPPPSPAAVSPPPPPRRGAHTHHPNASLYTLATITSPDVEHDDRAPLISKPRSVPNGLPEPNLVSYGAAPAPHAGSTRRILFNAALKMAVLFVVSTAVLGGTLWLALPTLEAQDKALLHVPKSFAELKGLNTLLKKYRDIYPYRIVVCYVTTYLFLQAFSLPGSMYLSILGGAVWGVPLALPLACSCVATGATLCYLISAALGPALVALPSWNARLENWKVRLSEQRENLLSYLIVIRIAPFPPHWVVNVICPHVGVGIPMFWVSTWLGIVGVSVIHTTIGGGLDQMTSAEDFNLISWRNFFMLSAVVAGALIPVGIRYVYSRKHGEIKLADVEEDEEQLASDVVFRESQYGVGYLDDNGDTVLAQGPLIGVADKGKRTGMIMLSESEDEEDNDDDVLPTVRGRPDPSPSSSVGSTSSLSVSGNDLEATEDKQWKQTAPKSKSLLRWHNISF